MDAFSKNKKLQGMLILLCLFCISNVFALCPMCTFVVGAGVGLTQYLGIDDTLTGIWLGGFLVSLILLTHNWCRKRGMGKWSVVIIAILYYGFILIPLYWQGILGHILNKIWGIDKLLLGVALGSTVFLLSIATYYYMKKHNNNHAYFPWQKVVMPFCSLLLCNIIFYVLTK